MASAQGFRARVRPQEEGLVGEADRADQRRSEELQHSLVNLGVAWSLALLCCTHHVGHWMHALGYHSLAHGALMNMMSNPWVSGVLGGFALLGPGRNLVKDGAVSLYRSSSSYIYLPRREVFILTRMLYSISSVMNAPPLLNWSALL